LTNLLYQLYTTQPSAIPDTSTTTTEIHPNTHKGHKTQQPPHHFLHSPTPIPASPFIATVSNSPNFIAS
jgi:hypothetical protein